MAASPTRLSLTWEYCASSFEATELSGLAQRVLGMRVRTRSIGEDTLGPHAACAAARVAQGRGATVTHLVTMSYDARPRAVGNVKHVLRAVTGCQLHR